MYSPPFISSKSAKTRLMLDIWPTWYNLASSLLILVLATGGAHPAGTGMIMLMVTRGIEMIEVRSKPLRKGLKIGEIH